jgi:hypothetical protein
MDGAALPRQNTTTTTSVRGRRGIFTMPLRSLTLRKYSTARSRQEMYSLTMRWTKTVSFNLDNSLELLQFHTQRFAYRYCWDYIGLRGHYHQRF